MREWMVGQSQHTYAAYARILALIPAGLLFAALVPWFIVRAGCWLDRRLSLPTLRLPAWMQGVAAMKAVAGLAFALWSIVVQFRQGRGTPLPVMATQELVVTPPYTYCRNPMALGTIVYYLGTAFWARSAGAVGLALGAAALLVAWIKFGEESELAARFGAAYEEYRQGTSFLVPLLW